MNRERRRACADDRLILAALALAVLTAFAASDERRERAAVGALTMPAASQTRLPPTTDEALSEMLAHD